MMAKKFKYTCKPVGGIGICYAPPLKETVKMFYKNGGITKAEYQWLMAGIKIGANVSIDNIIDCFGSTDMQISRITKIDCRIERESLLKKNLKTNNYGN